MSVRCALMMTLLLAGCSAPRYRWPQGFSETYHRAVFGDVHAAQAEAASETAAPPRTSGVFYPPRLSHSPPKTPPTRYAVVPTPVARQ